MRHLFIALVLLAGLSLSSCNTRKIERIGTEETIDLSGRWNDSDSRMTADAMVEQILNSGWLDNHVRKTGERPVVIVGLVYNKSHEHISAETFIKDVERAFINSGRVRLVQAGDKREELRRERASQQDFASVETAKRWGMELGADYMLDRKSTRLNSSHVRISYAVFCLKKKKKKNACQIVMTTYWKYV